MEIAKPTVGRIVHFYPVNNVDNDCTINGANFVPAIVVQVIDNDKVMCNLTVFIAGGVTTGKFSIPYESMADKGESYWEYPPKSDEKVEVKK